MVEIGVSLAAATRALQAAGFEPALREAPRRWPTDGHEEGVWVAMPGDEAYAIVVVTKIVLDDRPTTWREAYRDEAGAMVGYQVGFHERPFRTRGHGYAAPAARTCSVFVDDVVAAVRGWTRWEQTWSVTPVLEPARTRLLRHRRLATSKLGCHTIPVGVDIDPLMLTLLDSSQVEALHATIEELFLPGLRWRFPRDKAGIKLAARTQVLLTECAPPSHPAGKGVWLVADGPDHGRRSG